MASDKDIIVAIELGSSRIAGIAGMRKDGTMQVLAYAEEKANACIKRGVVFNIEKTNQSIINIIKQLEQQLKASIKCVYVGIGGMSVRSFKCVIKRDLITQSYITSETINLIHDESYDIPFSDYEVIENIPQEYIIDQQTELEPVGVMGTNLVGEFLNVIAKTKLRNSIRTCCANANVKIADDFLSASRLADYILTDTEKRSGCVLVDLGADTTTVVVYKNNIMRYLVTIPLGSNNINKDLGSEQIYDEEAEQIKLKYGDALASTEVIGDPAESGTYITSDGRSIQESLLRNIIEARVAEIIANVNNQVLASNYSGKLLAGAILTGGGAGMKNMGKAIQQSLKCEKVRIARGGVHPVSADPELLQIDSTRNNTIIAFLLAGTAGCVSSDFDDDGIVPTPGITDKELEEREKLRREAQEREERDATAFDTIKAQIRTQYEQVVNKQVELEKFGSEKSIRNSAKALAVASISVIGERYENARDALKNIDKFAQSISEGEALADKLDEAAKKLADTAVRLDKENSIIGRIKKFIDQITSEDSDR